MSVAKLKTPISYYGGKQTLLRFMLPLIPKHESYTTYTETYAGGLVLYFAKEPSELEVVNDINGNLVNFYRVLKSQYKPLKAMIDETLHSRKSHEFACLVYEYGEYFDPVRRAWALWVLSKMSFASKLDGTFGYDKSKNTVAKKIHNAREQFTEDLSKRLAMTQIEQTDAIRVIKTRDTVKSFHFVDPPYIGSDCGHYAGTFNLMDFQNLLDLLSQIQGMFMLTMFPHPLLEEYIKKHGWNTHVVNRTISASRTNRRKQDEWIVRNYTD